MKIKATHAMKLRDLLDSGIEFYGDVWILICNTKECLVSDIIRTEGEDLYNCLKSDFSDFEVLSLYPSVDVAFRMIIELKEPEEA